MDHSILIQHIVVEINKKHNILSEGLDPGQVEAPNSAAGINKPTALLWCIAMPGSYAEMLASTGEKGYRIKYIVGVTRDVSVVSKRSEIV
jgi:hypothetical protein